MKKTLLFLLCIISFTLVAQSKYQSDVFLTKNGKKVTITFIKHGSLAIMYENIAFQIDPVINYQNNITDYSSFPKTDFILITHEHADHYDEQAITSLEKKSTQIILNQSCRTKLGKGIIMKNGDKRSLGNAIEIEAVPAYNTTTGREKYHPKGRDNGYILTLDGLRIYIAGDTEDIPEMKNISNIDIAFLPINQPYTMTLEQVQKAVRTINPKVFYPYHYNDTPVQELVTQLKDTSIEVRIREMK